MTEFKCTEKLNIRGRSGPQSPKKISIQGRLTKAPETWSLGIQEGQSSLGAKVKTCLDCPFSWVFNKLGRCRKYKAHRRQKKKEKIYINRTWEMKTKAFQVVSLANWKKRSSLCLAVIAPVQMQSYLSFRGCEYELVQHSQRALQSAA